MMVPPSAFYIRSSGPGVMRHAGLAIHAAWPGILSFASVIRPAVIA